MRITANIITPLSAQTASENALLCGILSRSCKAYPDFTALSRKLAFLYGADINTSVSEICQHYGVPCIQLHDIDKKSGHPSVKGMQQIAQQIAQFIEENP